MEIRTFEEDDAVPVADMILRALDDFVASGYSEEEKRHASERYSLENLIKKAKEYPMFVAIHERTLVGVVGLQGNRIRGLFVEPAIQRQGIGKALVAHVEAIAIRTHLGRLIVYSSLGAVSFYEKIGYRKTQDIVERELALVIMEKTITQ